MALFPAFADSVKLGETPASESEGSKRELNWLTNPSFRSEDALRLHQHALEVIDLVSEKSPLQRLEPSGESEASESFQKSPKKRKKKKKQRHRKKEKKRTKRNQSISELELDTDGANDRHDEREGAELNLGDNASNVSIHSIWLDDIQSLTTEVFRTDKKPDPANWQYKSLYRGSIARYRRRGNFCLGIDLRKQHIIWEDTAAEKKQSHKRPERYFTKAGLKLLSTDGIPVCSTNQGFPPGSSTWIPVSQLDPDAVPTTSWANPLGVYDPLTTLWLQGKGPPERDALKQPATQENSENGNSSLMKKVEEYNRKVRENPRDVKMWMDFVSFQDELMRGPSCYTVNEGEQEMRKKSLKLLLEKKLAILERAIESNLNDVDLKLARLKLCTEFWEPSAVIKEWQKLVFLHPNNPALWQKYLLFCQSQFSTFVVSKVHSLYGKCLSTLSAVQDGSMVSHPALPGTEEAMLALFLQQCHFLRQAGHSEKAVSLFQALIDFTFFKPDNVKNLSTREQVEFFETFWDSGEPRIGEKGAKGWKAWMHQQEKGGWIVINPPDEDEEDVEEEEEEIKDKSLPKWQNWLHIERCREARHWLPWRPDKTKKQTLEDCEDPERQVLSDDLGPSLIKISNPDLQFQLLCSFLQFIGVPCGCNLLPSFLYLAMDENNIFDHEQRNQGPLTSFDLPLSGVSSIGHMDSIIQARQHVGHSKEGEEFIQNFFHMMLPLFSGKEKSNLSIFWLQYELSKIFQFLKMGNKKKLKAQGKKSKKLAKNLLKAPENRNNLSLWQLYAYLEWLLGNVEDARKVFDTALTMAGTAGIKNPQYCHLSLLYAELETELLGSLEGALESRAVHILTRLAERGPYVPYSGQVLAVNILKARKTYEHLLQDYLNESCTSNQEQISSSNPLVGLVGCYTLFQYLTLGIDSAALIYKQVFEKLKGRSETLGSQNSRVTALEALTLMHASLLRYHMKTSVYPLNPLREALLEALKMYPSNQSLWRAYIQIQSKTHNASKARRFFDGVTRTTKSLEPWLFAIRAEQKRKQLVESVQRAATGDVYATIPETGLTNRIRALFERAIETDDGAHCPLLWRLYVHFMVSLGNKEKSKGQFYRALQNCPWTKVIYMDAIGYFPDELQEILDLMTEKELRVRVPIEELELLLED